MASQAEHIISRSLRTILAHLPIGASIVDSDRFRDVLDGLDYFVPEILREVYAEWRWDSLDGTIAVVTRKVGDLEAELFGLAILISDQSIAPIHLRIQVSSSKDEFEWLECKLGKKGPKGMVRSPGESLDRELKQLHALDGRADLIDWAYKVTFGHRLAQTRNDQTKT